MSGVQKLISYPNRQSKSIIYHYRKYWYTLHSFSITFRVNVRLPSFLWFTRFAWDHQIKVPPCAAAIPASLPGQLAQLAHCIKDLLYNCCILIGHLNKHSGVQNQTLKAMSSSRFSYANTRLVYIIMVLFIGLQYYYAQETHAINLCCMQWNCAVFLQCTVFTLVGLLMLIWCWSTVYDADPT